MKHAYLIIAHKETKSLTTLLKILDDPCNDFFIHIDARSKKFNFEKLKSIVKKSKVYFTNRIKVYWGDYSLVHAEQILLKSAIGGGYNYYHLISGQDLPLKNNTEINLFFEENNGKQFINFGNDKKPISPTNPGGVFSLYNRLALYHFWVKWWKKNKVMKFLEYASITVQSKLKVNRISRLETPVYFGSQWFSITHDFAKYVVEQENQIKKIFGNHTRATDELFLQTVVMNSKFKDEIAWTNLRYIDWNRGRPYVWHKKDLDELLKSCCLFARKFDENVDSVIIDEIYQKINEK